LNEEVDSEPMEVKDEANPIIKFSNNPFMLSMPSSVVAPASIESSPEKGET
jgi:hypothetical protein